MTLTSRRDFANLPFVSQMKMLANRKLAEKESDHAAVLTLANRKEAEKESDHTAVLHTLKGELTTARGDAITSAREAGSLSACKAEAARALSKLEQEVSAKHNAQSEAHALRASVKGIPYSYMSTWRVYVVFNVVPHKTPFSALSYRTGVK